MKKKITILQMLFSIFLLFFLCWGVYRLAIWGLQGKVPSWSDVRIIILVLVILGFMESIIWGLIRYDEDADKKQ